MRGMIDTFCIRRDFDLDDLTSGQFCDFPIISQWGNIEMLLSSPKTHAFSSVLSGSCSLRSFVRTKIQFLISDLHEVIRGHPEDTFGFLVITLDQMKIETWGRPQNVRLVRADRLICNMTFFG